MDLSRRKFLSFLAAPAVVTAANIMPIQSVKFVPPADKFYTFGTATGRWSSQTNLQRIPFDKSSDFANVLHKLRMEIWNSLMVDEKLLVLNTDYSLSEARLAA